MSKFSQENVLSVHHWTDNLFSFTTTGIRRSASVAVNSP
ncbi:ferredoxin-NADP reductase [Bradyrhizobium sp. GM24.11]